MIIDVKPLVSHGLVATAGAVETAVACSQAGGCVRGQGIPSNASLSAFWGEVVLAPLYKAVRKAFTSRPTWLWMYNRTIPASLMSRRKHHVACAHEYKIAYYVFHLPCFPPLPHTTSWRLRVELICRESCPELSGKIVVLAEREVIRQVR